MGFFVATGDHLVCLGEAAVMRELLTDFLHDLQGGAEVVGTMLTITRPSFPSPTGPGSPSLALALGRRKDVYCGCQCISFQKKESHLARSARSLLTASRSDSKTNASPGLNMRSTSLHDGSWRMSLRLSGTKCSPLRGMTAMQATAAW